MGHQTDLPQELPGCKNKACIDRKSINFITGKNEIRNSGRTNILVPRVA